jgi:phage-related protein
MQIYFDNTSLMTPPYSIRTIDHDSLSPRELTTFNLARQRGGVLVDADYKPKTIKVAGTITGADMANLEDNIDAFKSLLGRQGKNLDIEYGGSIRRYEATAVKIEIPRESYHLTFAPFTVEFYVPSGVGKDASSTSQALSGISASPYVNTLSIGGTANTVPKITITFTAVNAISKVEFLCNGDKITIARSFAVNDILVIDCENMQVTVNGAVIDYTGIFPMFGVGANIYEIDVTATSFAYNLLFNFYQMYI